MQKENKAGIMPALVFSKKKKKKKKGEKIMENNFVKYDTLKPGDEFMLAGFTWIKLRESGMAIMKGIHKKMKFDAYTIDWSISDIRKYLNSIFLDILLEKGIMLDELKQIETKRSKQVVTLLSETLFLSNKDIIETTDTSYWLLTPILGIFDNIKYVMANTTKIDCTHIKDESIGIRPVIHPSENILVKRTKTRKRIVTLTDSDDNTWSETISTSLSQHEITDKINKVKSNTDWSFEDILNELGVERDDVIQTEKYYF